MRRRVSSIYFAPCLLKLSSGLTALVAVTRFADVDWWDLVSNEAVSLASRC